MIKKSLLLTALASASCHAALPSQFIAKQYTEALGRAPEPSGWQGFTNYAVSQGCSANTLKNISLGFFDSAEYKAKGYTPEEAVLTAYRAVFSREPDPSGFNFYVNYLKSGHTIVEALPFMFSSQEFNDMVPAICAGEAYGPIGAPKQAMDIGSGTWTQAQLESCIASNWVCNIPPRTVVYLNSTLTIPNGKTVQTQGSYDRTMYARQARIVRNSSAQGILIVMQPASVVRNIWVSGGRDLYKGALVKSDKPQENVFPNINYVGGGGGAILGVRSDAPLAATHIATFPVPTPSVPTSPTAFQGSITIQNNLTTGYAQSHYFDGTPVAWADGISNHITNATITGNDIVDPTDVGIVIFGHDGSTQASTASNNVIVHSGHSAYGSLGLDATQCLGSASACRFSGTGYTNNTIFAGEKQHSDIVLFNGTGAWAPPSCNGVLDKYCATGGQMSNNTSILGDANQVIQAQVSMAVDGMLSAVMSGNNLNVKPVPLGSTMRCRTSSTAPMVLYALSKGHASGSLQAGSDGDIDQCIGH
ncbi:hypothetical protein GCM10027277_13880 [Pseudoduganella ginsengisoli]|uniref:DUF4214 domain-containing protein n=1 Tax=Pseudoduganella ginsengisoli TaxID=1462440 RepID=A0A6L6PV27_9BURK|nr:DUF4214 domain-containing protein [Pseudoduganella ginsengisoli]MTW01350.1 DUF4214 domain-containing protein [Pseudoduganella ginsengisoli]